MLTGESLNYSTLFSFFLWGFPSSSVQNQLTVKIPFGIIPFLSIVSTPFEIMGYILSVNMSSSENICAFSELSTMDADPSYSNPIFSGYYTLEESMQHILFFENFQQTKVLFWYFLWGSSFLTSNWVFLFWCYPSWLCIFVLQIQWFPSQLYFEYP